MRENYRHSEETKRKISEGKLHGRAKKPKKQIQHDTYIRCRDARLQESRDWYLEHRPEELQRMKDRYQANKEEYKKNATLWAKSNPDRTKAIALRKIRTPHGRFTRAKHAAKRKEKPWNLSLEEYRKLISNPCVYCGGVLCETGVGLDRIDNRLGYISGNVVPCCPSCNTRKGGLEMAGFVYPRTVELLKEVLNGASENENID